MKMIDRNVDATMPPATAVPTELRARRPGARRERKRHDAENERERRHENRPQPDARGLDRRIEDRHALLAQLLGELDDQNRVLGGQADEHDEPDLTEHVVGKPSQQLRGQRAKHRERHAQQDDERQDPALVLRRQHQIDDEQAQTRR